jgi:hypothetical protein
VRDPDFKRIARTGHSYLRRCPVCSARPRQLWCDVVIDRGLPQYVLTCGSHYCRERVLTLPRVA